MTNYLIELGVIHSALILGYWLLLRNEQQYGKLRMYLIASTVLALIIPLLKFPNPFYVPAELTYTSVPETLPLNDLAIAPVVERSVWSAELIAWLYVGISLIFLFKLFWSIFHIVRIKRSSSYENFQGEPIRITESIEGSFSFFNWIFIGREMMNRNQDYGVILKHEKAHVTLGHTYDLLFFELFNVLFWWLPTSWFTRKEIKKIHEYQADAHALRECGVEQYSSILISSTLKTNGWSLASSFHDGLILKRLKAMKEQHKNLSSWKLGSLSTLSLILLVVFACTEDPSTAQDVNGLNGQVENNGDDELLMVVEESPEYPGGLSALYRQVSNEISYPVDARMTGAQGKVWVQFVIDKNGSVTDVQTVKGIHPSVDKEAARALRTVNSFKPGAQRGRPVRVKRVIPIIFQLDPEKKNPDGTPAGIIIVEEVQNMDLDFVVGATYSDGEWSGLIIDTESDKGLPGANIIVEGTTMGTASESDGSFKVKADKSQNLVISFVGYKTVRLEGNKE